MKFIRGGAVVEAHQAPVNTLQADRAEIEIRLLDLESELAKVAGKLRAAEYAAQLAGYSGEKQRIQSTAAICAGLREKRDQLSGDIATLQKELRSIAAQLPHARRSEDKAAALAGDEEIRAAAAELHDAAARFFSLNDEFRALRARFRLPLKAWPVPYKVTRWGRDEWLRDLENYLKR